MLFISAQTGATSFKTYTCDYNLGNLTEVVLGKQFDAPSVFLKSEPGWASHKILESGVVAISYEGQISESIEFDKILSPAVDLSTGTEWAVPVNMDNASYLVYLNTDAVVTGRANLFGYTGMVHLSGSGTFLYSSNSSKAVLIDADKKSINIDLKLPIKPGTSVTAIPGSKILYYSTDNTLICEEINVGFGSVVVFDTVMWESVGGPELVPAGNPVYGLDSSVFSVTESGKILKFDNTGTPVSSLSIAGVKEISEYNRTSREFDLTYPENVPIGTIPILLNNKVYSFDLIAGDYGEVNIKLTSGDFMALSLDGVVWGSELVVDSLLSGGKQTIYFVVYPAVETPEGVSDIELITAYSSETISIPVSYKSVRPKSIVVPVKTTDYGLSGEVIGDILVTLQEEGNTSEKINCKATFPV